MRISFSCDESKGLESRISARFARSKYFIFVDVDDNWSITNVKTMENPAAYAPGGAGVRAAQILHDEGVNVAVAGNFGPNSLVVLNQFNIKAIVVPSGLTVKEALNIVKSKLETR